MTHSNINRVIGLVISALIGLIGYIFLQNAMNWGSESISNYVRTQLGGSIDTAQYNILLEQYISTNKWIGAILLVVGLVFFLRNIENIDFSKNQQMQEND